MDLTDYQWATLQEALGRYLETAEPSDEDADLLVKLSQERAKGKTARAADLEPSPDEEPLNDEDLEVLRKLVDAADAAGIEDPDVEKARTVILCRDLEDGIAQIMKGFGVEGIEWGEEDGTVTDRLDWDEDGNVKR